METLRRLGGHDEVGDGRRATTTLLLTLPLSDFSTLAPASRGGAADHGVSVNHDDDHDDDDGLILLSLPQSSNDDIIATSEVVGRLTIDDLLRGDGNDYSVYILGDTSERDILPNHALPSSKKKKDGGGGSDNNSIEPVPARLIVEGRRDRDGTILNCCKTMELTRVETSNTYIVLPTTRIQKLEVRNDCSSREEEEEDDGKMIMGAGNPKRQRMIHDIISHGQENAALQSPVSLVPARSIGIVPGEDSPSSCFFLDPHHLPPGHFAQTLRRILSRWVYDPFNPPVLRKDEINGNITSTTAQLLFGYSIPELAHICRTSIGEVEYAIGNRVFGAEDAMVIPSLSATMTTTSTTSYSSRYGMLSEEGRQTVSMAILSVLLESDLDLIWVIPRNEDQKGTQENKKHNGMQISLLINEIRSQWHQMEGEDSMFRQSSQSGMFHTTTTLASTNNNNNDDDNSQSSQIESQSSQFGTPSQFLPTSTQREVASSGELATEVIWHCLRPLCFYYDDDFDGINTMTTTSKDSMPEYVQLFPDEVAKLAAHQVFLSVTPRSSLPRNHHNGTTASSRMGLANHCTWPEEELLEEWSMRLPSISSTYEPRTELLRGIAISDTKEGSTDAAAGEDDGAVNNIPNKTANTYWTYFPEVALPLDPALRIQAMFVVRDVWSLSEAVPHLEKFIVMVPGKEGVGDGERGGLHSMVADLFGRHANVINGSADHTATKYLAKH